MNSLQRYKPKHEPGCECSVCWTHQFCNEMHARNDARQKRCHEILNNPFQARFPRTWSNCSLNVAPRVKVVYSAPAGQRSATPMRGQGYTLPAN